MKKDRLAQLFCIAYSSYQLGISTNTFEKKYFNSESELGDYWEFLAEVCRSTLYNAEKQNKISKIIVEESESTIH